MCDMQNMPTREDDSCEEDPDMNFAAFQASGLAGPHYVATGGPMPMAKIQQNVAGNGTAIQQMVGMMGGVMSDGVQYVQSPQVISVPIALPGHKPGDPQPTVQIQVLNPNMLQQQQQPKYQMQIPIQGFQQGGAVITVAYSPDGNDGSGIQLLGNTLPDGMQVLTMPQEMQLLQTTQPEDNKEQIHHQMFITPNQQIVMNSMDDNKLDDNTTNNNSMTNNNTINNNNNSLGTGNVIIKEECDDNMNDDESSQGTETSDSLTWQTSSSHEDLVKYLNTLPPQQALALPASLQQFLRLNPGGKKVEHIEIEVAAMGDEVKEAVAQAVVEEDGTIKIQSKKRKKYKKRPPKPARPKPGQVVIAQASDGTPIYCCPECQMAYPEKSQLETHLGVHKIERRFICGICGAGLKRKEHLERHKLGHNPERPYVCGVCRKGFKRREHLNLHTVIHSGVKTEMCTECGKGFYRKDHLRKHARTHETLRQRHAAHEASLDAVDIKPAIATATTSTNTIMPEITIHVPTSANMQVPVQINIPQHVMSSLQAANDAQTTLDALLAHHS